ncbi:MAG TPA: c-type cytochrome [Candidatus Acidoferrales bacterium]|nr:c-type cytochrome [Candidatus Acidoferrales bacterium]
MDKPAPLLVFLLCVASNLGAASRLAAQDPLAGSQVFGSRGCAKCHAVGGVGGKVGPDLKTVSRPRSFYDLAAAMWNHLPKMADQVRRLRVQRPRLDAREAEDLIAFLATLDYFDPPGDSQKGKRLFSAKRCVVCHQAGGVGGVVGPNLDRVAQASSPIAIAAAMWNHGPAMAEAMRAKGIERPTFSATELRDLITFLKSHAQQRREEPIYVLPGRAEEGRRLFVERRCAECHGAKGEGGRVRVPLYSRNAPQSLFQFAAALWNKAPAMLNAMREAGVKAPQLNAEEMANIVAYLYSVNYFAQAGNAAGGKELMATKGCVGCHNLPAETRPGLIMIKRLDRPAGFISGLWNHLALLETPEQRRKVEWPQLTPQQVADIVAFLSDGRKAVGQ